MVPATFTKRDHRRQYDEEEVSGRGLKQSRATQGTEGEPAYNFSRKWKVHNCNFQLFLFESKFETPFWRNGLAGHQI